MEIPIVKLKNTLDSLLEWIVTDWNDKATESDRWLYKVMNGNVIGNYDFYVQAQNIFLRDEKSSRKLETREMFDKDRANLPTIHIHVPAEQEGGENPINQGGKIGDLNSDGTSYNYQFTHSMQSSYDLVITGTNTMEVIVIYEVLKALFIAAIDTLQDQFEIFNYSGKSLMANSDIIPYLTFYRAMTVKLTSKVEVPSIIEQNTITNITFTGDPYND